MQELIKISKQQVGSEEVNAVSSTELHGTLEVKTEHSKWIKRRIDDLGLIEGIDFVLLAKIDEQKTGSGGHNKIDYILTLDSAKHIAMAERNEMGKKVRLYFIQAEKELRSIVTKVQLPDFTNPAIAARAWADEVEKKQIAETKVKELEPKADAYDVISNSRRLSSVSQVSALFGLGRNRLYKILKEKGMVMENNKPYQKWIDSGHFDYKIDKVNGKQYFVTLITGKGIRMLQDLIGIKEEDIA
jgi:anti-repressor protein